MRMYHCMYTHLSNPNIQLISACKRPFKTVELSPHPCNMPKRQRPPSSPGSPAKRSAATRHSIADLFPFQEIFLRILSFLSANELAKVQGVCRYWQVMSLDPQVSRSKIDGPDMLILAASAVVVEEVISR